MLLRKTDILRAAQCPKSLYLSLHLEEKQTTQSELLKHLNHAKKKVIAITRTLFPDGFPIKNGEPAAPEEYVERTRKAIAAGHQLIYDAVFISRNLYTTIDILKIEGGKAVVYDVKGSTKLNKSYFYDAALQVMILNDNGFLIKDIRIIYVNPDYTLKNSLDLKKFLIKRPIGKDVKKIQDKAKQMIRDAQDIIDKQEMPDIQIGDHCTRPRRCIFFEHCREHLPDDSVFDLTGLHGEKKYELYREGVLRIADIPDELEINHIQSLEVAGVREGKKHIDRKSLRGFLDKLKYPLLFLDFESFAPLIPHYPNTKPFQVIPFQYSLHRIEAPGEELKHMEYIHRGKDDPRGDFVRSLIRDTSGAGSILVYNKSFEASVLKALSESHASYHGELLSIKSKLIDLMIPFERGWFYLPEMHGSHSLKNVLPAISGGMDYDELNVSAGREASTAYEILQETNDPADRNEILKDLSDYCKLDTYALWLIYQRLVKETE